MPHNLLVSDPASHPVADGGGAALPDPRFPTASWWQEGYSIPEVDAFVAELKAALRRDPPTMAPYEVADQRFGVSRLQKGYRLRPVDDYLDAAQERLREQHGADAVATLQGHAPAPRHVRTGWIYLIAFVLILLMVGFTIWQL